MIKKEIENAFIKISVYYPDVEVVLLNYGATLLCLSVPDKFGNKKNIILAYDEVNQYLNERPFIGSSIGRSAGRIKEGRYKMDGIWYNLEKNEGDNHLHGGTQGFDNVFWHTEVFEEPGKTKVCFSYCFHENSTGYPGSLKMEIYYVIYSTGKLEILYQGVSDKKTIINPSNHTYFNLSGEIDTTVHDHRILINSNEFLVLNKDHTIRKINSVVDTPFDIRQLTPIETIIHSNHQQIEQEGGINHPFIFNRSGKFDVLLVHDVTGRFLKITSSMDGVVCYSANHFDGKEFKKHSGIALETQNFVGHSKEEKYVLRPNKVYQSKTVISWGVNR